MDTKRSDIPKKETLENQFEHDCVKMQIMLLEFNYSLLQLKVDGRKENNLMLKIIAIDKILKLHFPDDYIVFISKSGMELLTNSEKIILNKWLSAEKDKNGGWIDSQKDVLIKYSFFNETNYIYELKVENEVFYLLLKNKNTSSLKYNFIKSSLNKEL